MKFKKIAALLGAFTIASSLFIAGCGNTSNSQKTWRVGTDATYAPFGFKDKDSGKLAGFDIDIINAIAQEEGIEADIQNLNFDALLPALQSNTIDIAISDMTISEDRAKSVDFSKPYYIAGNGLVVNIDNTTINSFKDLEGKRIGVSIGSTGAEIASKIPNADVHQFNMKSLEACLKWCDVVAIGPGIGTLTQYLCESAKHVFAVEIDDNLIPILQDTLSAYDNVTVIHNDVLKLDINKLVEEKCEGKRIKVVANLPYYITTPILMGLFESHVPMESVTVMVQKEVAQRMQALPGGKDYGALSLAVQFYAEPYIVANVPPNCFMPRPNVGSAVIRLTSHKKPVAVKNEKLMFDIIRASFNQRRKTLVNGLYNVGGLNKSKEELAAVLESIGLAANVRGETLTLEQFAALSDALSKSAN